MIRHALIVAAIAILPCQFASADATDGPTLHSSDGQYQLSLPKDWESKDFHLSTVQIGAMNKHKGEYAEVIVEDRGQYTDSLAQYAQAKRDTMAMSLDNPSLTAAREVKVNGLDGVLYELHGQLPNSETAIAYTLTCIKTKSHYVQIVCWTQESHFAENRDEREALAAGFTETPDAGK
jgi:hypothetical protein